MTLLMLVGAMSLKLTLRERSPRATSGLRALYKSTPAELLGNRSAWIPIPRVAFLSGFYAVEPVSLLFSSVGCEIGLFY